MAMTEEQKEAFAARMRAGREAKKLKPVDINTGEFLEAKLAPDEGGDDGEVPDIADTQAEWTVGA